MTVEIDTEVERLRALLRFTQIALPDYATDPIVQVRVGRVLADISARVRLRPIGDTRYWPRSPNDRHK